MVPRGPTTTERAQPWHFTSPLSKVPDLRDDLQRVAAPAEVCVWEAPVPPKRNPKRGKPGFWGNGGDVYTPKINIEPENDDLEDDFPLTGGPYSQVNHVSLPGCSGFCRLQRWFFLEVFWRLFSRLRDQLT